MALPSAMRQTTPLLPRPDLASVLTSSGVEASLVAPRSPVRDANAIPVLTLRISSGNRRAPAMTIDQTSVRVFYGWRVVAAAFVLAVFGWGVGFYGPPVFLHAVREVHGWSLPLVSAAVTAHFVV